MKKTALIIVMLGFTAALFAQTAKQMTANEVVERADSIFTLKRVYSRSRMTVFSKGKARPEQLLEGFTLEQGDKSLGLTIFKAPKRVQGTAYLTIEDDLWVRFSSTGRVRKLSSSAKKNSAGGSDFSYSDMSDGSKSFTEKYDLELDGWEKIDGTRCYKVVLSPRDDAESVYERADAYISEDDFRYRRVDYYEDGVIIKSLSFYDYRAVDGLIYPFRMVMESKTKDSRTEIVTDEIELNSSRVKEHFFSTAYLETIQ